MTAPPTGIARQSPAGQTGGMIRPLLVALLAVAAPALAQPVPAPPPAPALAPPDYTRDAAWLCRPNRDDPCNAPLETSAVAASGEVAVSTPLAPAAPKIDCFYVYPTVSTDPGVNSDMTADPAERYVAAVQFAPFRRVCRTFAPLYRQLTLAALRGALTNGRALDFAPAEADVAAAWAAYLRRDNDGRGVILIGHSQGARMLKALLQQQIEGRPEAGRVVAAYLIGNNVLVPAGKLVGGDFKSTPLCRAPTQTGCVVSYVTFRAEAPPPADSRYGRAGSGMAVACTNPAALAGGPAPLRPLFPSRRPGVTAQLVVWATGLAVQTPFVTLPGLLSAECVDRGGASYLAVTTAADPADPRLDRIPGDTVVAGQTLASWGLHLVDMTVAMNNLVDLAGEQGAAWLKR